MENEEGNRGKGKVLLLVVFVFIVLMPRDNRPEEILLQYLWDHVLSSNNN